MAGSAGLGGNLGAIVVNAALSVGYGYDSRGAAEVHTVIHAAPAGEAVFEKLMNRTAALPAGPPLPEQSKTDTALLDASKRISDRVGATPPAAPPQGATPPAPPP